MSHDDSDDMPDDGAVRLTPSAGFDIRTAAPYLADLIEALGQPLIIQFPGIDAEFEHGCTAQQIIDGYEHVLEEFQRELEPSNSNLPGEREE